MPLSYSKVSRYLIFPKNIYRLSQKIRHSFGERRLFIIYSSDIPLDRAEMMSCPVVQNACLCTFPALSWLPPPFPTTGRFAPTKGDGSKCSGKTLFLYSKNIKVLKLWSNLFSKSLQISKIFRTVKKITKQIWLFIIVNKYGLCRINLIFFNVKHFCEKLVSVAPLYSSLYLSPRFYPVWHEVCHFPSVFV